MKTKFALLLALLLPFATRAADDLSAALQKGLFEEEANQNLPAAIKAYESLLAASDEQRKLAATALFRLGECYRKLGRTNDAVVQYQRVIRDFTDQTTLATLSRQNLRGLGVGMVTSPTGGGPAQSIVSAEAEELARTERILAQLGGWDLGQVRRLLPTVVPDADFERYDRLLVEAQEKGRTSTGEAREEWRKKEDEYTARLRDRFNEVKQILRDRVADLRTQVSQQKAEASRPQAGASGGTGMLTPAQIEAQRLLIERLELEIKTAEAEIAGYNRLIEQKVVPSNSADKVTARLLDLKRQLILARDVNTAIPQAQSEAAQSAALYKQLQDLSKNELVRVLPNVVSDPLLNSLVEQLAQAERIRAEMETSFSKEHPDMKTVQSSLKQLNQQITERIDGIMRGLEIKAAAYKQQSGETTGVSAPTNEEQSEIRRIQALIKNSPDLINASGKDLTPLHVAAAEGKLAVVRFLLDNGAKPDLMARDNQGPALLYATENGHKAVVELLLSRGADPNIKEGAALQAAAANGFTSIVDVLLANKADINRLGYSGTALHRAVDMRRDAIVERLLKSGANVNASNYMGETALHIAARLADAGMIRLLLSHKADVNAKDGGNAPPLWRIWDKLEVNVGLVEKVEAARVLLENGAATDFAVKGESPVHGALKLNSVELIELLLKHKAAPDLPNGNGLTPLHVIALRREDRWPTPGAELIPKLVSAGANPNRPLPPSARALRYKGPGGENSYQGYPPLCAAITRGDQEVAEALLASGADVNGVVIQAEDKYTALMEAVYERSTPMVEAVLRHKPDLETRTQSDGMTALHKAVDSDRTPPEVITALTKAGADVNAADNRGWTPLHIAADRGDITAVKALLEAGANPNASAKDGSLPLSIPRMTGRQSVPTKERLDEIVGLLVKFGADETLLRRRSIVVTRRGANYEEELFRRGTNDFNQFSVYELMARLYIHGGPDQMERAFPDLRQIAIERLGDRGQTSQLIVDLESRTSGESCTNDMWLEWGDRIEIREKEHALNAGWPGLDGQMATNISRCISRSVSLVIKGRTNQLDLQAKALQSGQTQSVNGNRLFLNYYRISQAFCGLSVVIKQSGMLLTTSDLSRVRVARRDAETGKSQEWTLDETNPNPATDFWLRDGDIIEVPEKP